MQIFELNTCRLTSGCPQSPHHPDINGNVSVTLTTFHLAYSQALQSSANTLTTQSLTCLRCRYIAMLAFTSSMPLSLATRSITSDPAGVTTYGPRRYSARVARVRSAPRMAAGDSSELNDLDIARKCYSGGCSTETVNDVIHRLETRRAVLQAEIDSINVVTNVLSKATGDTEHNVIADAVNAAIRIFSPDDDDFPLTGIPSPFTMDKPKKGRKNKM
jgi:hypothetical protein